jgi:thiol-disulfide isomerase/thioredoxin
MKKILAALLLMISMNGTAQDKTYSVSKDPKGEGLVYNGLITFDDLNKEATFTWLKSGSDEYKPDQRKVEFLKNHFVHDDEYSLVVFLGTWCDDSHELIPKLEKVLQLADVPKSKITMYGVDREKTTQNHEENKYKIKFVPTIIVYHGDKEAGRITESVQKSIEADLAAMFPIIVYGRGRQPLEEKK